MSLLTLTKADWNNMTWEEATSTPLNAYRASKAFSVSPQYQRLGLTTTLTTP
jgi:hypothetical protein